jgi:phosphatidylserine/phosphatidylglycerophosphate/cardiolipin synthase-like enzyme
MDPNEIDRLLQATLADHRLSGGEKEALRSALKLATRNSNELAFIRHRAFAMARAEMISPEGATVLDWLEEIVKLLQPMAAASSGNADVARACFTPDHDCVGELVLLINRAKRVIDICVFTITDDRISGPIISAKSRGLDVRIIADDEKENDPGSDIQRFRDAGIPVRIDRNPSHMHHKFALFDGSLLLTGSYNWTRSAAKENRENFLITSDARLIGAYAAAFERLWNEYR